jgi:hypothetical protein
VLAINTGVTLSSRPFGLSPSAPPFPVKKISLMEILQDFTAPFFKSGSHPH